MTEDNLEAIAEMSISDGAILNNPRIVMAPSEVPGILKKVG